MKSCRTASIFAMGGVVAVFAVAACRESMNHEVPPLTTASPDRAPLPRVSPELYLGRLEGAAPVAEHSHAGFVAAAVEDAGSRGAR